MATDATRPARWILCWQRCCKGEGSAAVTAMVWPQPLAEAQSCSRVSRKLHIQSGLLTHETSWLYGHRKGSKGKQACWERLDIRLTGSKAPPTQTPPSHIVTGQRHRLCACHCCCHASPKEADGKIHPLTPLQSPGESQSDSPSPEEKSECWASMYPTAQEATKPPFTLASYCWLLCTHTCCYTTS